MIVKTQGWVRFSLVSMKAMEEKGAINISTLLEFGCTLVKDTGVRWVIISVQENIGGRRSIKILEVGSYVGQGAGDRCH